MSTIDNNPGTSVVSSTTSSAHPAPNPHTKSIAVDGLGFDDASFELDVVTPLQIYRAEVRCEDRKMIGPAFPIDAFCEQDRALLRLAVRKSLIKSHLIGDRLYVTGRDLSTFAEWTGEQVRAPIPANWEEDLAQVTAALDGIEHLDWSDPSASSWPFHSPADSGRTKIALSPAQDDIPGPITPISRFGSWRQQVLSWCIREALINSITIDEITYVFYSEVYGRILSNYFEREYDHRAAWDGTYDETWSPRPRIQGRFVKPRGFKDAVRGDMFPRISLSREVRHAKNEKGEIHTSRAAYPRHIADRAAEMVLALYRQDGFLKRFREYRYDDAERDASAGDRIELLSSFGDHEAEWFRKFAAEGGVKLFMLSGEEYISVSDLMYYDIFAAKIVEDEIGPGEDPDVDDHVEVMLDGTFCRGWSWQRRAGFRRAGGTPAAP